MMRTMKANLTVDTKELSEVIKALTPTVNSPAPLSQGDLSVLFAVVWDRELHLIVTNQHILIDAVVLSTHPFQVEADPWDKQFSAAAVLDLGKSVEALGKVVSESVEVRLGEHPTIGGVDVSRAGYDPEDHSPYVAPRIAGRILLDNDARSESSFIMKPSQFTSALTTITKEDRKMGLPYSSGFWIRRSGNALTVENTRDDDGGTVCPLASEIMARQDDRLLCGATKSGIRMALKTMLSRGRGAEFRIPTREACKSGIPGGLHICGVRNGIEMRAVVVAFMTH